MPARNASSCTLTGRFFLKQKNNSWSQDLLPNIILICTIQSFYIDYYPMGNHRDWWTCTFHSNPPVLIWLIFCWCNLPNCTRVLNIWDFTMCRSCAVFLTWTLQSRILATLPEYWRRIRKKILYSWLKALLFCKGCLSLLILCRNLYRNSCYVLPCLKTSQLVKQKGKEACNLQVLCSWYKGASARDSAMLSTKIAFMNSS